MLRISTTQIESFRLFMDPEQDWMPESDLIESIQGVWKPNRKEELGSAFGRILADPDRFLVPGGFECDGYAFDRDVVEPCLALIDRRGTFEAKFMRQYGDALVVSRADQIIGTAIKEFKTTWSGFNVQKYLDSCQWRFMADALHPSLVTYHVFCLHESEQNGVIELKSIETFNVYPYPKLHEDCTALARQFVEYVTARGLDGVLRERHRKADQSEAA